MLVSSRLDSSILARSAASVRRCRAGQPVHDPPVVVVATQVGVAVGGLDLEDAVADVENGHIERAAAQVEHQNRLIRLLVQAVRQGRGSGLVDDADHVQTGDLSGVLGGLTLRVVEVSGYGDDGVGHLLAQVRLGVSLELLQDHRRDLFRRELLVCVGDPNHDPIVFARLDLVGHDLSLLDDLGEFAAHEALDRVDGVFGVHCRLPASEVADQPLAGLREGDNRGRGPRSFGVRNDHRLAALHDGDD